MKNLIHSNFIYLIVLLSIFSNTSSAQDITGKWVLSNVDMTLLESATAEQKTILETKTKPMMDAFLANFIGKMSLEFNSDGTFILDNGYKKMEEGQKSNEPKKEIWNKAENKLPMFLDNFPILIFPIITFTKGDLKKGPDVELDQLIKSRDVKYEVVDGKLNLISETDFMIVKAVFVPK